MVVILPGQHWRKDIVISRPPAEIKVFFFFCFFFLSAGGRHTPRSALAEGYRNIPAPRRNKVFSFFFFFFLSAGGRHTPRSALAEKYRNIPAPRRNKVFFFLILYIRLELWPTEDAPGYAAHHPWTNIPQGHYSRHFCYFVYILLRIHRAPQSNGGRPWVVGWTLGTDPRGMSRAKCTAHRPWANIPQGHQFFTVPFV